jgi:hypothetical protein
MYIETLIKCEMVLHHFNALLRGNTSSKRPFFAITGGEGAEKRIQIGNYQS